MAFVILFVAIIWTANIEGRVFKAFEEELCNAYPVTVPVSAPGCNDKFVQNQGCYGQCFSKSGSDGLMTCKACWPTNIQKKNVTLDCRNGEKKVVQVPFVMYCQCMQRKCPTTVVDTDSPAVATTEQITQIEKEVVDDQKKRSREARRNARKGCKRKHSVKEQKQCLKRVKYCNKIKKKLQRSFKLQYVNKFFQSPFCRPLAQFYDAQF